MKEIVFGIATTCLMAAACSGEPIPVAPDPGAGGGDDVAGRAGSPIFAILPPDGRGNAIEKRSVSGTGNQGGSAEAVSALACQSDADCPKGETCGGASNCPPGAICILPPRPGVCKQKPTCPAGKVKNPGSSCGPVVIPILAPSPSSELEHPTLAPVAEQCDDWWQAAEAAMRGA